MSVTADDVDRVISSVMSGLLPLHGHDVAQGFGRSLEPSHDVCRRVLARLFPQAPSGLAGVDPWTALLWAGGRVDLPGHSQRPNGRAPPRPAYQVTAFRAGRSRAPRPGC